MFVLVGYIIEAFKDEAKTAEVTGAPRAAVDPRAVAAAEIDGLTGASIGD